MNLSILRRVIWKEYRLQRALWLLVAGLAIATDLVTLWCDPTPFYKVVILHYIALTTPALYLFGCGAMMFAGEHEAETYEFQRSLPIHALQTLVGKVAVAILGAVVMWGLMLLLAELLAPLPTMPKGQSAPWRLLAWATVGFFSAEVFVWAVFFSLLTRRVLIAAVLGVSAASIAANLAGGTITWSIQMETYVQALPWRIAIVAIVALADVWLAARWFREKCDRHSRPSPANGLAGSSRATHLDNRFIGPQRFAILGRLLWQHWRQSRRMSLIIVSLLIPLVALLIAWVIRASGEPAWYVQRHAGNMWVPTEQLTFFLGFLLAMAAVPLFGVGAFLADQRKTGFRFLTDRGVPPKFVWLSRLLVTFALPMFVCFSLLLGLFLMTWTMLPLSEHLDLMERTGALQAYTGIYYIVCFLLGVVGYVFLGIAVGQLCSMFLRSPLLAGLCSIVLTAILVVWSALMHYWQVSWLWSILPIPFALLLATRLRTGDWLLDRNTLRGWLRPGLALLIPAIILLVAVPLCRVHSIPLVDPGFSLKEFTQPLTPAEERNFKLYQEALRTYRDHAWLYRGVGTPTERDLAWLADNRATIATLVTASREKIVNLPESRLIPPKEKLAAMARLLALSAVASEQKGELDTALDHYLAALRLASCVRDWYPLPLTPREQCGYLGGYDLSIDPFVHRHLAIWAAQKGQTSTRIIAALHRLEESITETPAANPVKLAHLQLQRFLAGDKNAIQTTDSFDLFPLTKPLMSLPSERARAERLLNLLTRSQLQTLAQAEERVKRAEPYVAPSCNPDILCERSHPSDLPYALLTELWIPPVLYDAKWGENVLVQEYLARVTSQRALQIVLRLEAWKAGRRTHGSLPKTLSELFTQNLGPLPVDPYSGQRFHYFPDGFDATFAWSQPRLLSLHTPPPNYYYDPFAYESGKQPAKKPFLWSSGSKLRYLGTRERGNRAALGFIGQYEIFTRIGDSLDTWRAPDSELEVWQSGWAFRIP